MQFVGTELEISPSMIKEDPTLQQHFKLMLNASIGKFGQHSQSTITKFVQTQVRQIEFDVKKF